MIAPGQTIGNYRIVSKIGTGGMGAVYLAEHPLIGKRVALKVIHRELANNREVVQRFFQEARAVNKIGNEHIVEIHDFGQTPEGDHFYIMEYLDGPTLAHLMSRNPVIDVMRSLHIGAQVANALAAAHASGVIHRDLKPDNIMLVPRNGDPDFVKVLDFGLAKIFADASAVQTAAGVLLGTPQYMSPEACESRGGIDHRTDVYALGVLLFQMMTGKLPFDGESMGEVLIKQITVLPPAPRAINPAIPPSVEQILLRCLAKPVDARFATMFALREALLAPDLYLGSGPPIQPARSISPGEMGFDAKAVMSHAAHQQHLRAAGGLPLPAPNPSQHISGQQATMIADGGPPRRTAVPAFAGQAEPRMNTMRIATPLGHSSRPPRRVWPIVLVLGVLLGLGGGVFAVVWFGNDGVAASPVDRGSAAPIGSNAIVRAAPGSATIPAATGSAASAGSGSAATGSNVSIGSAAAGSGSAISSVGSGGSGALMPKQAKLSIDSIPVGADVFFAGKHLGKTPFAIEFPVSGAEVPFEFRLTGYKRKVKPMVVGGNTAMSVELERATYTPPVRGSANKGSNKGSNQDGLMPRDD